MSGDQLAPDQPCPSCGRTDPRAAVAAFTQRTRARSVLLRELHGEGLTTAQVADVVTGVRPVSDVLAERDATREDTP